jgi:asparagine N-glycosylation enzyme membrane subunit Stt3
VHQMLYLKFMLLMLAVYPASLALAQVVTGEAPASSNPWEHLLKLIFPVILTAVGPILTGFIKTAPSWVKFIVASVGTTLVGFGAGSIADFHIYPNPDTGAEMGLGAGATSQAILNGWLKRPDAEAAKPSS